MLKNNCKGKRTVGKTNKRINVEKIIIGLKKIFLIRIKKRDKRQKKRGKLHRIAKAQCRGWGL